jgi:hypothetical protein
LRVRFAGLKTPLLIRVTKKAQFSYAFRETAERDLDRLRSYKLAKVAHFFREGVGRGLSIKLTRVLTGALKKMRWQTYLTAPKQSLLSPTSRQSFGPAQPSQCWSSMKQSSPPPTLLSEFLTNVEELAKITATLMRKSEYEKIEDIVYGLATLVDHDRWVAGKISAAGFDDLARKLSERALETALSFAQCSMGFGFCMGIRRISGSRHS